MSRAQMLRALVDQRLTAAVEEIFGLFERTIAEYEEEVSRSKEQNDRQRKLLDAVLNPEVRLHRADAPQLLVSEAEQQDWSPSLDQEDPEPPHIKEEQEELWTSQEGEQLRGPEEADITEFTYNPSCVESRDQDRTEPSLLRQTQNREGDPSVAGTSAQQMKPEADGEDLDPAGDLQPTSDDQLLSSHCSEPETEDSDDDWKETREPQSGFNTLKNNKVLLSHKRSHTEDKQLSSLLPDDTFHQKGNMQVHVKTKTGERPFSCRVCGKRFAREEHLQSHMTIHTGEKPFSCSLCDKRFCHKRSLLRHVPIHTEEKPFDCTVCGKSYCEKGYLKKHMIVHTGEKPFSCNVCGKRFNWIANAKKHKCVGGSSSR